MYWFYLEGTQKAAVISFIFNNKTVTAPAPPSCASSSFVKEGVESQRELRAFGSRTKPPSAPLQLPPRSTQ